MNDATGKIALTNSSWNVLKDLQVSHPAEEDTKMDLAVAVNDMIAGRKFRQVDAAKLLGACLNRKYLHPFS